MYFLSCCNEVFKDSDQVVRVADAKRGHRRHTNLRLQAKLKVNHFRPKISSIADFDLDKVDASSDCGDLSARARLYMASRVPDGGNEFEWLKPITSLLHVSPEDLGVHADEIAHIWQLGSEGSYGSVSTHTLKHKQPPFGSKLVDYHPSADEYERRAEAAGIGIACRKGLQHGDTNQDSYMLFVTTDKAGRQWTCAGVFDGHGPDGHTVSLYAARMFLWCVLKLIEVTSGDIDAVTHHLYGLFGLVHTSVALKSKSGLFDAATSGSTATLTLLCETEVVCAWAGDSRCIVCDKICVDLSTDHKPDCEEEETRIIQYGGRVFSEGNSIFRVISKSNPQVALAMSRSIGDLALQEFGVTWEPGITRKTLDKAYLVTLCSDGIWEFISSQEVADMLLQMDMQDPHAACENLCQEAQAKWIAEEGDVVDDTTVICILGGISARVE